MEPLFSGFGGERSLRNRVRQFKDYGFQRPAQLAHHQFDSLPIRLAHALAAGALPRHHEDPFDRMLVAQAKAEGLTIATRDSLVARYEVPILRA